MPGLDVLLARELIGTGLITPETAQEEQVETDDGAIVVFCDDPTHCAFPETLEPGQVAYRDMAHCNGHLSYQEPSKLWALVLGRVDTLTPEQLGDLIWHCDSSLYNVHSRHWLPSKYASGREFLRQIAATAVVASIRELLQVV